MQQAAWFPRLVKAKTFLTISVPRIWLAWYLIRKALASDAPANEQWAHRANKQPPRTLHLSSRAEATKARWGDKEISPSLGAPRLRVIREISDDERVTLLAKVIREAGVLMLGRDAERESVLLGSVRKLGLVEVGEDAVGAFRSEETMIRKVASDDG